MCSKYILFYNKQNVSFIARLWLWTIEANQRKNVFVFVSVGYVYYVKRCQSTWRIEKKFILEIVATQTCSCSIFYVYYHITNRTLAQFFTISIVHVLFSSSSFSSIWFWQWTTYERMCAVGRWETVSSTENNWFVYEMGLHHCVNTQQSRAHTRRIEEMKELELRIGFKAINKYRYRPTESSFFLLSISNEHMPNCVFSASAMPIICFENPE